MRFLFLLFLFLIAFDMCAQIKVSAQKDIDFSRYKTFSIQKGQVISMLADQKVNATKIFQVLKAALSREMLNRGFTMVDDSTADLVLTYVFEEAAQSSYEKPGPLGQTPLDDPAHVDELNRTDILRTLIIEIEDNRNKRSLWTATCPFGRTSKDVYFLIDATTTTALKKMTIKKR